MYGQDKNLKINDLDGVMKFIMKRKSTAESQNKKWTDCRRAKI